MAAQVQQQLVFPCEPDPLDRIIVGAVPEGVILPPAERMDRLRRIASETGILDRVDDRLAELALITGEPPGLPWRARWWLDLSILAVPGAGSVPGRCDPARARQWIAEQDWRQRIERKRRISVRTRRIVIAAANGRCRWCSRHVADEDFTIDHVIPVTRGGRSYRRNLVASCWPCNHEKSDMLVWEWLASWAPPGLVPPRDPPPPWRKPLTP